MTRDTKNWLATLTLIVAADAWMLFVLMFVTDHFDDAPLNRQEMGVLAAGMLLIAMGLVGIVYQLRLES